MDFEVTPCGAEDVDVAIDILAEASAWLGERGIRQWPRRFSVEQLLSTVERNELHLVVCRGRPVGTVTLQWSDPAFWGSRDDAGFMHRLAIRRGHPGLGREVIGWVNDETERHGRQYVCLDTLRDNTRLRNYYEGLGFSPVGEVDGPADHAHTQAAGAWTAVLYERPVTTRA